MVQYYIVCRSLTYGQWAQGLLKRNGVPSTLVRTPGEISPAGCSYALRVSEGALKTAVYLLNQSGMGGLRVYLNRPEEGEFEEVTP